MNFGAVAGTDRKMVPERFDRETPPDAEVILDALDDPACRRLIADLSAPMTARELSEASDMPLSTTYRKLDLLSEASIVETRTYVRQDGHHTTQYVLSFEAARFTLDEGRHLRVSITRPARSPDEQLAQLWSAVRQEI